MDEVEEREPEKDVGTLVHRGIVIAFVLVVYLFLFLKLMFF